MTDTAKWFYKGVEHILAGDAKWPAGSNNIYMALYTTFNPTQATDEILGSFGSTCTEVSGGGYTTGGVPLTSVAAPTVYSATNVILSSANVTFSGAMTFTGVNGAIIYYKGTSNFVLGYIEWDTPKAAQGDDFIVKCPPAGWFEQPVG